MSVLNIVLFTALLATATAKIVNFQSCEEGSDDMCKVNRLVITPCGGNKNNLIYKGTNTTAKINITPHFDASKLMTTLYYTDGITDTPVEAWDNQVGSSAGRSKTLIFREKIAWWLLPVTYNYKCKIWNADDKSQFCCFKITVDITSPW